jgi:YgiT-type zinc finger domain-containing protein
LTPSQPPITRTTYTLPFDKLSPRDLERLCLWLVEREGYEHAGHIPNPPSALPLLSDRGKIPSGGEQEGYTMKCIICHSTDISLRRVNEQLSRGEDLILVPLEVLVCNNCGERYYDRRAMKRLEEIEDAVNAGHVSLERVGEVLRVSQEMVTA